MVIKLTAQQKSEVCRSSPFLVCAGCRSSACWVIVHKECPSRWLAYRWLTHVVIRCKCIRKVTSRPDHYWCGSLTILPFKNLLMSQTLPRASYTHTPGCTPTTDEHCGCQCSPTCASVPAGAPSWHFKNSSWRGRIATVWLTILCLKHGPQGAPSTLILICGSEDPFLLSLMQ